jgi:hypothetical protein
MGDFEAIPYRIRIGVTGHRSLGDPSAVQAAVKRAIDAEVQNLFPADSQQILERVRRAGSTPIAFRVLSPLAEGADRVVARAVLEYPAARLDVVLPLALEDYLEDFSSEESKREFSELLAQCSRPVKLRIRRVHDDRRDTGDQAELRRSAYAQVGRYVVDNCDVLIAVWDGLPSRGRGGTAAIVQYAEEQKRPVIVVWEEGYELLNPGSNNGLDASAIEGIDRFNRQSVVPNEMTVEIANFDREYFETPRNALGIPVSTRELVRRKLFPYYAIASAVAIESQKRFHRAGKYIYSMSAAAVGCAALGVLFPSLAALGFGTELGLLIVMAMTFRRARNGHSHQRWIEHRFLAERIRCGIFMVICGVEPRPIEVLPHMGHSQTVNDWTLRVIGEIWDRLPPVTGHSQAECLALNAYVQEAWVGEQVKFHTEKKEREGLARKRLARASEIVLPITIAAAALHLMLLTWQPASGAPESLHLLHYALHQGLAFVALLFPAIAASLAGMEAHREHLRLEKRSANMGPQLERLNRQMASATDPERFEELLHQLDEIMLRETQDWLMLMRFVEIKAS